MYKGAFGAHVAFILRRLRRLCKLHGAAPSFACCSATVGNPTELFTQLTGLDDPAVITEDGSPHGRRRLLLWNPPLQAQAAALPPGKGVPLATPAPSETRTGAKRKAPAGEEVGEVGDEKEGAKEGRSTAEAEEAAMAAEAAAASRAAAAERAAAAAERAAAERAADRVRQIGWAAKEAEARARLTAEAEATDEAIAIERAAKVAERDAAIKLVLAKKSRTLRAALGLAPNSKRAEVAKRGRQLLRLLHPDFAINRDEGSQQAAARIEAAFKKLTGLRDKEEG